MASTRKKRKRAKGAGRPKGSTTRGPTVAVGFRIDRDLLEKIDRIRKDAEEMTSRTLAMQRLLDEAIRAREAKIGRPIGEDGLSSKKKTA